MPTLAQVTIPPAQHWQTRQILRLFPLQKNGALA
jgi:hypothetical protein